MRLYPPIGTANLSLPCGSCLGCKTDRASAWARRCVHEASLWPVNSFVTLTYEDRFLPGEGHLVPSHLQKFLKRLRKHADSNGCRLNGARGGGIRYFACGEYGERGDRPHYHALLFNAGFVDQRRIGADLWESPTLDKLWGMGACRIGTLTGASAAYVAQYSLKKIGAVDCDADGVVRPAPFVRMSLKPGIGSGWAQKYQEDLAHGYLVEGSRRCPVPRFYRSVIDPQLADTIVARALDRIQKLKSDRSSPARLAASEVIHKARSALFSRGPL